MFASSIKPLSYDRNIQLKHQESLRSYIRQKRKYLIAKRSFDLVLSAGVILLLMSWLLPLIAILIKLSSKGSIFFVQKRVGFLGRSFNCYKFRTMVMNRDADTEQAVQNDPRITRMGKFLRNSNLDELPQFFNVLIGNMTIVGPRPHMHSDCANFSDVVDNYKFRNIVKPGITGLAQVKGFRGPAKTYESIFKRYQWDAFYVRNANFWMDIRIVRITAWQTISFIYKLIIPGATVEKPKENGRSAYRKLLLDMRQRLNGFL
ncbi:sugar transferase [Agriterribacter sp.]|uniref:sugar transferase n=1 Tax=Agriterribacter sp. TaxID=2821509 RepID=UPI002D0FBF88|nr:sugar transferase [Agriterribacter sp.]HTN08900.1 sugar transferase [Agriterribacter sp.]